MRSLIILLAAFLLLAIPVLAQTPTLVHDFASGDFGWTGTPNTGGTATAYRNGAWESGYISSPNGTGQVLVMIRSGFSGTGTLRVTMDAFRCGNFYIAINGADSNNQGFACGGTNITQVITLSPGDELAIVYFDFNHPPFDPQETGAFRVTKVEFIGIEEALNASFTATPTTCQAPCTVTVTDTSSGNVVSWVWDYQDGTLPIGEFPPPAYYPDPGTYTITLSVSDGTNVDSATQQITVTEGDSLTRPLSASDTHPQWSMWDWAYANSVDNVLTSVLNGAWLEAFSATADAPVAAIAPGLVTDVIPIPFSACPRTDIPIINLDYQACEVFVPQYFTQELFGYFFQWEMVNVYQVVIRDEADPTTTWNYFLQSPTVDIGDSVVEGCIIGATIQLKNMLPIRVDTLSVSLFPPTSISFSGAVNFQSMLTDVGHVRVIRYGTQAAQRFYPNLADEPSLTNCREATFSTCVTSDSELKTGQGWEIAGGLARTEPGGGVVLDFGQALHQRDIAINPTVTYTLTIAARAEGTPFSQYPLLVSVGSKTEVFGLSDQLEVYTFTPTPTESILTSPGITSIRIANNQGSPDDGDMAVFIEFVCLSPNTVNVSPGSCYFANHQFDADSAGWTNTGGVTFASGQAFMPPGSTLSQAVTLRPDTPPHTYRVSAQVRLLTTGAYTGQVGKSVSLDYRFPQTGSYANLGLIDSALVNQVGLRINDGTVNLEYPYKFEDELVINAETTGTFSFQVTVIDPDAYIKGLRIDYLCLSPQSDDGKWPGEDDGWTPPFVERCARVPEPIENSIGPWIFYHWKNSERFFECDLMKLLNQQFQMLDNFQRTARLIMRYNIATGQYLAQWVGEDFTPWLAGYFTNMSRGASRTITVLETASIGDFITGFINVAVGVKDAILSIGNLIIGAINSLISFFGLIRDLVTALVNAINTAQTVEVAGIGCNLAPDENLICAGFWVLDNTVLAGPGAAIIPIFVSFGSVHALIWLIQQIKQLIEKQSAAV